MDAKQSFLHILEEQISKKTLVKLTLSKPIKKGEEHQDWQNVFARLIELKGDIQLSCTLRYKTRDETKNFALADAKKQIEDWLKDYFYNVDLFSEDTHWSLQTNKKNRSHLRSKALEIPKNADKTHDYQKKRPIQNAKTRPYLTALGIANKDGEILKSGQKKFKQINKYIELISHLLKEHPLPEGARIVDMGSGKGYLTFALYDYLVNEKGLNIKMTGIELRPKLVEQCKLIAIVNDFDELEFVAQDIHQYQPSGGIDMLIALHACDTATDEALAKGINADASIIVVAPCCQKQVRKDMIVPKELKPILQHGILLERQAELLTDSIRSLVLEAKGYKTKVFEFISTEHTPKNVMITATRSKERVDALDEIKTIRRMFGVSEHFLLNLLDL